MPWPRPPSGLTIVNALAVGRDVDVTTGVRFSDGRRGLLDIYAPKGAHDAPMVVFFYGGGWEDGQRADYKFVAMALAKRGIVTVVPDYRLYPDVRFPDFLHDGARAVRWARRNAIEFGADRRSCSSSDIPPAPISRRCSPSTGRCSMPRASRSSPVSSASPAPTISSRWGAIR